MKRHKVDAFIIYEYSTGKTIARDIKQGLERFGIATFVAPQDVLPGGDEESIRLSALRKAKEIFIIITHGVMLRPGEVENELKTALNAGKEEIIRPYRKKGITSNKAVEFLRLLGINTKKQCQEFEDVSEIIDDILARKTRGEYFAQLHKRTTTKLV